jgi:hypothetical protein
VRIFTRLLDELYRVAAKYRCALIVMGAAAPASLSLAISEPALAQCSGLGTSAVDCPSGPYPNGISASQPVDATTDLNVLLRSGVSVTGLAAPTPNAVDIFNQSIAPTNTSVVMENGATIDVTNVNGTGLHLQIGAPGQQTGGDATVKAAGTITVNSNAGANFRQRCDRRFHWPRRSRS